MITNELWNLKFLVDLEKSGLDIVLFSSGSPEGDDRKTQQFQK